MTDSAAITVRDNADEGVYEADVGPEKAITAYELGDGTITYTHTYVPPEAEGQGVGGALVRFALDDARARGLRVIPLCPFVRGWIERHPEYDDLVHPK